MILCCKFITLKTHLDSQCSVPDCLRWIADDEVHEHHLCGFQHDYNNRK